MDAGASSLPILVLFMLSITAGRLLRLKLPGWVFTGAVLVVVFSVSAWAAGSGISATISALIVAFTILSLTLLFTLAAVLGLSRWGKTGAGFSLGVDKKLLGSVGAGWTLGLLFPRLGSLLGSLVFWEVMLLIAITGLYVSGSVNSQALRRGARVALEACAIGILVSVTAGYVGSRILGIPANLGVAMALGMGWYSFSGPYIASAADPSLGLAAFLLNLLREQITFILVPALRGPKAVMLSLGGATTMDNTLPVYIYAYGEDLAPASVLHGFILTVLVPFLTVAALSF